MTGAGTGFGQCIAIALALAGATVFLTGRRIARLEETRARAMKAGADGSRLVPLPADITDPDSVAGAARAIERHGVPLYGLVNSAALPQSGTDHPLAAFTPADWDRLLRTNVTGQWLVTRAALPLMLPRQRLRVLFLSSEAGWASTPGFGPYNLGKAALNNLGVSFAAECAARLPGGDIQINVLVPGEARTEMNQGSTEDPFSVVCMTLVLLSHPAGGPNGHFFHRDGRHLAFGHASPYPRPLLEPAPPPRPKGRWFR